MGNEGRYEAYSQAPRPMRWGAFHISYIHDDDGASLRGLEDQLERSHVGLVLSPALDSAFRIRTSVLVDSKDVQPDEGSVRGITEVAEDSLHRLSEASLPGICDHTSRDKGKGRGNIWSTHVR